MINNDVEQLEKLSKIKVLDLKDNEDKSAKTVPEFEEQSIDTHKHLYQLANWDQKHFENSVTETLKKSLLKETRRNEQNPDFLWTNPEVDNG